MLYYKVKYKNAGVKTKTWNAGNPLTSSVATVPMNRAREKGYVANVLRIILQIGNFPVVHFLTMRKKLTIGLLNTLPGWS